MTTSPSTAGASPQPVDRFPTTRADKVSLVESPAVAAFLDQLSHLVDPPGPTVANRQVARSAAAAVTARAMASDLEIGWGVQREGDRRHGTLVVVGVAVLVLLLMFLVARAVDPVRWEPADVDVPPSSVATTTSVAVSTSSVATTALTGPLISVAPVPDSPGSEAPPVEPSASTPALEPTPIETVPSGPAPAPVTSRAPMPVPVAPVTAAPVTAAPVPPVMPTPTTVAASTTVAAPPTTKKPKGEAGEAAADRRRNDVGRMARIVHRRRGPLVYGVTGSPRGPL